MPVGRYFDTFTFNRTVEKVDMASKLVLWSPDLNFLNLLFEESIKDSMILLLYANGQSWAIHWSIFEIIIEITRLYHVQCTTRMMKRFFTRFIVCVTVVRSNNGHDNITLTSILAWITVDFKLTFLFFFIEKRDTILLKTEFFGIFMKNWNGSFVCKE